METVLPYGVKTGKYTLKWCVSYNFWVRKIQNTPHHGCRRVNRKRTVLCDILSKHSSCAENCSLLGCYAVSSGKSQRIVLPSS